jgi:5-bromo-4-chloroindolyl phosphate hydrolysis protein
MSKIIRTEKPSVLPWYAMAATWLLLALLLPVYRFGVFALAAAAGVGVFFAAKKICPPRVLEMEVAFHTGVGDVDEMLAEMSAQLDKLHKLNEELPEPALSAAMDRMEKAGRSIAEAVETSPDKAKAVRRFANYYLPDAVNVLSQYATLARQGVRGENAAAVKAQVEQNAASIATAFENQLDGLYAAESMDISADLDVLQNLMKGQGLG